MIVRTLLFIVAGLVWACAPPPVPQPPLSLPDGTQFSLSRPGAGSVAVAGNFNGWSSTENPMVRSSRSGMWSTVIPLPPGEYLFMFVVDGEKWVVPPLAEDFVPDGFGQTNGVVIVR